MNSFREFWPFYVGEHSRPLNRRLHFVGTTLFLATVVTALVTQRWWLLLLSPIPGYSFAWIGHFFVEKNRPATFKYPFYSLAADFVMYGKMWAGTMDEEVKRSTKAAAA